MISERPLADGRHTAVFVFNELKADAGRLTLMWLARLRAFDSAGWATHAVLINKDAHLQRTVSELVAEGHFPAATGLHHYALRDRRIRPSWWGPLPPGGSIDPRVGDWLDWLTGRVPGAVVFADSPAAYPYLAAMSNPLVARVAGIHLNHLASPEQVQEPSRAALTPRFADRLAPVQHAFEALVVMTEAQAGDLRARFGPDAPTLVIPPAVPVPESPLARPPGGAPASTPGTPEVRPDHAAAGRIVSVGPLEPTTRHDHVLRAAQPALAADPGLALDLVGEGEAGAALLALAEELGLGGRVRIVAPGTDEYAPFAGAVLTVWAGRRESFPLAIVRSLAAGVPVVAYDARYGPAELLAGPETGELVASGDVGALALAVSRWAGAGTTPAGGGSRADEVLAAAGPSLRRTEPLAVWSRWTAMSAELADRACDRHSPSLLVESLTTLTRVLRMPGVLADSATGLTAWSCELPGMVEPAGWLIDPPPVSGVEDVDDADLPVHPHAAGPTREVVAQLRSNVLALTANELGAFRVEFTDGSTTVPLLTTGFEPRIVASRVGNATLERQPDGSVWVSPRPELLMATNVDGRLLVRIGDDGAASDITHALDWVVDIDWADLAPTPEGATFTGVLRATSISPADDSPPAICVTDVGGFSRTVGLLRYTGEPTIDHLDWTAPVAGVIETDPLVATTDLARGALALHVGFRGLLVPIGGLWTHGRRSPLHLSCPRGLVTLLPSPGGRVLVAPGKGYRARTSGAIRGVLSRG
ncbi:MAG TPA: glycosyltransferase [Motilibacterales bacterium]|nr:glycosyltransferase [Motilibacterales bacterium]